MLHRWTTACRVGRALAMWHSLQPHRGERCRDRAKPGCSGCRERQGWGVRGCAVGLPMPPIPSSADQPRWAWGCRVCPASGWRQRMVEPIAPGSSVADGSVKGRQGRVTKPLIRQGIARCRKAISVSSDLAGVAPPLAAIDGRIAGANRCEGQAGQGVGVVGACGTGQLKTGIRQRDGADSL